MLKKLLSIPNTFDPDDRRRRQVLNVFLIVIIVMGLPALFLSIVIRLFPGHFDVSLTKYSIVIQILAPVVYSFLLWMNRSPRIPAWFTGTIFVTIILLFITRLDDPAELYNGRSTLIFVIPILLGAMIFPTGYQFLITLSVCLLIQFLTPFTNHLATGNSVNYFVIFELIVITFISWFGQRISDRAIRDARKQAESASHHAANLEAILNSISDGVLVLDLEGKFISANPALRKIIHQDQLMEIISKPLEKKMRLQHKLFVITTSPVPQIGSVAIFRDETRRYETERAKDALLATASHELRTPLTAVMNYLEMIQVFIRMGKISAKEFDEYINRAIENMHRLHGLVNNILDRAQIQAGMLELKERVFDLPALLEKNRRLLDVLLKQKNLSYSLSLAPDVPVEINADPDRLNQILVNLLGNAIKFTQQGGIQVRVYMLNKNNIAIDVSDSGSGIAYEQLPDIFEAFRRGSDYAQREQQGAGLGLSITKEIVNHMGGDISVTSALGKGSTFTVSIPIKLV